MKRKLLTMVFMTGAVLALSLSGNASSTTGFCEECAFQCLQEGWTLRDQCLNNGGSNSECYDQYLQYTNNCVVVFCNSAGCRVQKLPRTGPGGN